MFTLPLLPFAKTALEPYMSANTLSFHYDKHHQTYIDNLNKFIAGTDLEKESLENIIALTRDDAEKVAIFNNAAQVFNHTFFWNSLRTGTQISPTVLALIEKNFSSLDNFYLEFKNLAVAQFGSGWVWLVKEGENLKIVKTSNASLPDLKSSKPLFALDVWEHSYYLDYQNRRADYVEAIIKNLLNWDHVASNLV